jgi:hypothetical protein
MTMAGQSAVTYPESALFLVEEKQIVGIRAAIR